MATGFSFWRHDRLGELVKPFWNWVASVVAGVLGRWRHLAFRFRIRELGLVVAAWLGLGFRYRSGFLPGLGASLILVLVAYHALANVLTHQGYHSVAFAKPALPSVPWERRVAAFGGKLSQAFALAPDRAVEFAGWILEAADRQRLDPELIASLVRVESGFRKKARSHVGAIGPAQVRPRFWREFCGGGDLTDPGYNIHCGAQVLAYLAELCGGGDCALVAYNVGRNSTRKQAARRFVSKIDHNLMQLRTL